MNHITKGHVRPLHVRSTILPTLLAVLAVAISANDAKAAEYYASPTGTSSGDGSISRPWDIGTAFQTKAGTIRAGDTLWLRGGTYGTGNGYAANSYLNGTASQQAYVRQYPGERATINGALGIVGSYVSYWGFEITNKNWAFPRRTGESGSFPGGKPNDAVIFGQGSYGNKLINMIIHDGADGIADQQESMANEHYGNLVYNNGWSAPDRGHGHNLYYQNRGPLPKLSQENITYNAFDIGIQAYGEAGPVTNLTLDGNVAFNSGLPGGHRVANIIFLGGVYQTNISASNNIFYNPLDATAAETGYNQFLGPGADLTLKNNWFVGATPTGYSTLQLSGYQSLVFQGNTVVGPLQVNGIPSLSFSSNKYFKSAPPSGADPASPIVNANPTGQTIFVRPNKYEPGRANIIVMNWAKTSSVTVDISNSGLQPGAPFEVRDSQNFWGTPVLSDVYNGNPITLPMQLTTVSQLESAGSYPTPPHTSTEFNAFILLPQGVVALPPGQGPVPLAVLDKSALSFSTIAGAALASQSFNLKNGGAANTVLNWTATTNQTWLTVSPTSGQYVTGVSGDIAVSVNTGGLAPGNYSGVISVNDVNNPGATQAVSISLALSIPPPPSGTSLLTNFTLGTLRNDFTGFVGMKFTTSASAMTVSHLARLNVSGNSKPHLLKLINASTGVDVPGGSVSITPGSVAGSFAYGALAATVVLTANTPYFLASQETSGQDQWYELNTVVQTTADASVNNAAYSYNGSQWLTSSSTGHTYGPSNLAYTLGGTTTPPVDPNPPTDPNPPGNPSNPPVTGGVAFVTTQALGTVRNNYSGFVGLQIRVGNSPLTVTAVGRIVAPGNSKSHLVKIVDASTGIDVTGGSATVATAGVTAGTYAFSALNSIVLSPNSAYYILTQETMGGDTWYDLNTIVTTTSVANVPSAIYGTGPVYYPVSSPNTSYGPVNFQYQAVAAPGSGSNTATFVKFDKGTLGNWTTAYGSEGKAVVGDQIIWPTYANVSVTGASTYIWDQSPGDARAPQKPSSLSTRIAGTWYAGTSFSINVPITDGNTHQIALYGLDWDNYPRQERIDVIDAATQTVLDSRSLTDFRGGTYAVWNIKGNVIFRVTNLVNGTNAVLSGIFFGGK